jgi:hypothetical protein
VIGEPRERDRVVHSGAQDLAIVQTAELSAAAAQMQA